MKALILAGGFATRLWPITESRAKPLLPVAQKPIISHIVEKIPENIEIIISTNASFAKSFENWKKGFQREIKIFIEDSEEEDAKKGALGATSLVIQKQNLKEDLFLLAGDNLSDFNFSNFLKTFSDNPLLAAFDIGSKEEAKRFGVVIEKNGKVIGFEEKPENPKSTLVGTAYYVIPAKYFDDLIAYSKKHSDNMGGIFEHFLSKKIEIDVFKFKENWFDIGSFSQYIEANLYFGQKAGGENFVLKGKNSVILESDIKNSSIGKNSKIEKSEIKNSVIFENVSIKNSVIENSVIDKNTIIENLDIREKMIREDGILKKI